MQVGSLIQCVNEIVPAPCWVAMYLPKVGSIYTVRQVFDPNDTLYKIPAILIEEGVAGYDENGVELAYEMKDFRELQPPMDLTELLKETEPQTVLVTR